MTPYTILKYFFLVFSFLFLLTACGGGDDNPVTSTNKAPTATDVAITGATNDSATVGTALTGDYKYKDTEGDKEDLTTKGTSFRWLRGGSAIDGATTKEYILVDADVDKAIKFEVTPVATAGTKTGISYGTDKSVSVTAGSGGATTYNLTISKLGTGTGTVTPSPAGTSCGTDCTTHDAGTVVTLNAAAGAGSTFIGWTGDAACTGGSVTLSANVNCIATFDPTPVTGTTFNLTINKASTGTGTGTVTSSPAGTSCGTNCTTHIAGTVVALTATASADSTFMGWSGAAACTGGSVTLNANVTCIATFDLTPVGQTFNLTINTIGTGTGTVTRNPAGIACSTGANCTKYATGTVVTLTPTPTDAGSEFIGWTGSPDCTDGSVTLSANITCIATFNLVTTVQKTLTIITDLGTGTGTVTRDPAGSACAANANNCTKYNTDTVVALTPQPNADSEFITWGGDADCTDGSVTLSVDVSCTAKFDLLPVVQNTLTVSSDQGTGSGSVIGSIGKTPTSINCPTTSPTVALCEAKFDTGTIVTLTATPTDATNVFVKWTGHADCLDKVTATVDITTNSPITCNAIFDAVVTAPTISSVDSPIIAHGGKLVITGLGFTGVDSVTIDATPILVADFTVDNDTQITIPVLSDNVPKGVDLALIVSIGTNSSAEQLITVIHLVINEVDATTPPLSDTIPDAYEFIELSTGIDAPLTLTGYSLILWNGLDGSSYAIYDLGVVTTSDTGLLVIGSKNLLDAGNIVDIPFADDFTATNHSNILRNGEDAVAIYQGTILSTVNVADAIGVIDALVYESVNDPDKTILYDLMNCCGTSPVVAEAPITADLEANTINRCADVRRSSDNFVVISGQTAGIASTVSCP